MRIHSIVSAAAIVAVVSVFACGEDPQQACEDYLDAALTCVDDAYAGDDAALAAAKAALDGACDSVNSEADYFHCLKDAYANGDCSTVDGYLAIASDLSSCTP